jgi:hypothetical protein
MFRRWFGKRKTLPSARVLHFPVERCRPSGTGMPEELAHSPFSEAYEPTGRQTPRYRLNKPLVTDDILKQAFNHISGNHKVHGYIVVSQETLPNGKLGARFFFDGLDAEEISNMLFQVGCAFGSDEEDDDLPPWAS